MNRAFVRSLKPFTIAPSHDRTNAQFFTNHDIRMTMPLLSIKNLRTHLFTDAFVLRAVDNVSFSLGSGESIGIVGESGCGKTMMALSLMRLLPTPPAKIIGGQVLFQLTPVGGPADLLTLSENDMRSIRGRRISMVFQEPMTSLNPVRTIGDQISEAIEAHEKISELQLRYRSIEMLQKVGISSPQQKARSFPHQLSGGMRQRVMIAIALACRPDILIADEPTTALDVTVQADILEMLSQMQAELGMSMILVTHDLGVVANMTSKVLIMYAGKVVEQGSTAEVMDNPRHPYTQGLLRSIPPLKKMPQGARFETIPGSVPNLAKLPIGCAFADRCPKVGPRCRTEDVPDDPCNVGRLVRCFYG